MKYKSYVGHVSYDDEAKIFHGEVLGLNDVVTFQGKSVQELEQTFKDSIDDYLDFCEERGESPEKPYSGKFNLRLSPKMHAGVAAQAKRHEQSINSFVVHLIEKAIQDDNVTLGYKKRLSLQKRTQKKKPQQFGRSL